MEEIIGSARGGGAAAAPSHHNNALLGRADVIPLKMNVFDAIQKKQCKQPACKRWALYRKALRVFLLAEISKPELDAVVLYTLGEENVHLHNNFIRGLLHNVLNHESASSVADEEAAASTFPSQSESRPAAVNVTIPSGLEIDVKDRAKEQNEDEDEDAEEDKARCKRLYDSFQETFGRSSSLWDVWEPMREESKRRRIEEEEERRAELDFAQVKAEMDQSIIRAAAASASSSDIPCIRSSSSPLSVEEGGSQADPTTAIQQQRRKSITDDNKAPSLALNGNASAPSKKLEGDLDHHSTLNGSSLSTTSAVRVAVPPPEPPATPTMNGIGAAEPASTVVKKAASSERKEENHTVMMGGVPVARMPGPLFTHYLLRCAGASASPIAPTSSVVTTPSDLSHSQKSLPLSSTAATAPPLPRLAVSKQAVELLDTGAKEFVYRIFQRCVKIAEQRKGVEEGRVNGPGIKSGDQNVPSPPSSSQSEPSHNGDKAEETQGTAVSVMEIDGSSPPSSSTDSQQQQEQQPTLLSSENGEGKQSSVEVSLKRKEAIPVKEENDRHDGSANKEHSNGNDGDFIIDTEVLFKALRVPNVDNSRDPIGRLFPSHEVLEDLVISTMMM